MNINVLRIDALNYSDTNKSRIPYTGLKPTINKLLPIKRQERWSNNIQIKPVLGEWRSALKKSRREQVVISRLRIGYTRLTLSFFLKQEPQPQCLTCQTTCPVKQILIECRAFAVIRKRFFRVNSLTDLFENVKIDDLLSFLRETGLYQKIWQQRVIYHKKQPTNQRYNELKLVNHVQTK